MMLVVFPGKCQNCGEKVTLDECKCDYEGRYSGRQRIFLVCPHCGVEIANVIKDVKEQKQ